jgi:23S rRNA G2069 N7-methylase RlmK/C1962 C5-methylase RlmI
MNSVRVNKRGADRVRQGHLWIYKSDVVDVSAAGGAIVTVKDERGNLVGQALFSASGGGAAYWTLPVEETSRPTPMLIVWSIQREICCRR